MVKKADVLVENFRPGVKKRLGIDYKTLARVNPRLVYAAFPASARMGHTPIGRALIKLRRVWPG